MEYLKMAGSAVEFLVCTELLPAIRKRYGTTFALLEIPEIIRSDGNAEPHGAVYSQRYDGKTYNDKWSEQPGDYTGGCALGTELSSEMVQLLADLQQIDGDWLLSLHSVAESVKASAFDLQGWQLSFQGQKTQAVNMGITTDEFTQAEEFTKGGFHFGNRIFTNGDFYPRNLIKLPTKIVLVDWAYSAGYRICYVDYLVNVAAFAFIHMWGNSLWQEEFVKNLKQTFGIRSEDFRKAVLIKSFEQARFWQGNPHLTAQVSAQVNHFKRALKGDIFW